MRRNILSLSLLGLTMALCGAGAAYAADDALGRVNSVTGQATAQRPGEEPRPLACGDPVYSDDTLRTAPGARVGVMLDDVATHLDAATQVKLGRTAESQPAATLEVGKVRMIDPRDAGAPARLAALDAHADVVGNDAEAYVFAEKVGPYAMLCEWDSPLSVGRGDAERLAADPGECVISKPKEPLYVAKAHDERIPAAAPEDCDLTPEIASRTGSPLHHLTPADVAAAGPMDSGVAGLGGVNPAVDPAFARNPCDVSGSCPLPLPLEAFEPEPVGGPAPGAGGGQL
jgi:hypothetical protein